MEVKYVYIRQEKNLGQIWANLGQIWEKSGANVGPRGQISKKVCDTYFIL